MTNQEWKEKVKNAIRERYKDIIAQNDKDGISVFIPNPSVTKENGKARALAIQAIVNDNGGGKAECVKGPDGGDCDYVKVIPPVDLSKPAGVENAEQQAEAKPNFGGSIWDKIKAALSQIETGNDRELLSSAYRDYDHTVSAFPLNVIFSGPPGTGKTWAAKELLKDIKAANQCEEVCFHPAMAYEDFVRALVSDGAGGFKAENRVLGDICDKALAAPDKLFAILIDEINRANLPAVLGQLMTALEYRGEAVSVPHEVEPPQDSSGKQLRDPDKLVVPQNLLVIGTMNTADRSTGLLDYALRRRFIFFHFKPIVSKAHTDAKDKFKRVLGLFYKDSDKLTDRSEILAPEFKPDDVAIGHSYFMAEDWKFKAKHQVAPLLNEYLRDGVLTNRDKVEKVIKELTA